MTRQACSSHYIILILYLGRSPQICTVCDSVTSNKLAKLRRHASQVHFAKIHLGKVQSSARLCQGEAGQSDMTEIMRIISPLCWVLRPTATWVPTKNPTRAEHWGGSGGRPRGLVFRCPGVICVPGVHAPFFPPYVRILAHRRPTAEAFIPIHVRVLPDVGKLQVAMPGHPDHEERDRQQPEPHLVRQVGGIVLPSQLGTQDLYVEDSICLKSLS